MDCPIDNYVGLLQEKCQKSRNQMPIYSDESSSNEFKFSCKLNELVTNGSGPTKKMAKQNSAKAMLNKIEEENVSLGEVGAVGGKEVAVMSSISKLAIFCTKEKKAQPLFAEIPKEDELFCIRCTFLDYEAVGKGVSKKEAKEDAASKVADHFGIHEYYDELKKSKDSTVMTSSIQELSVLCKLKRLDPPIFEEEENKVNNVMNYKIICSVGDMKEESNWNCSKKAAKHEVATLMLQKIKSNTPQASPSGTNTDLETSPTKKLKSD